MTHVQNFVDTVLAIAFVEAIVKPVTIRATKRANSTGPTVGVDIIP